MALAQRENGSQGHTYFNSFLTGKGFVVMQQIPFLMK